MRGTTATWSALVVALLSAVAASAQAPEADGVLYVGLSADRFTDYESAFSERFCQQDLGAITQRVGYRPTRYLALEGSTSLGFGLGEESCLLPGLGVPAPQDGDFFRRNVPPDGLLGTSFFSSHLAAVVEPFSSGAVVPRARVGVGRIWDKDLGTWLVGAGARVRVGRSSVVAEIERWSFGYDVRRELLVFRTDGNHDLQSVEVAEERETPLVLRLGWEIGVR